MGERGVSSDPHRDGPAEAAPVASWQEAVAEGLARLGWSQSARIDPIASDIAIVVVDAFLERDLTVDLAGASTFSLSIVLEGSGRLSARGVSPVEAEAGTAVLFACNGPASGEDLFRGGRRFRIVDLRFEESFLLRTGDARLTDLAERRDEATDGVAAAPFLVGFPAPASLAYGLFGCARFPEFRFGLPKWPMITRNRPLGSPVRRDSGLPRSGKRKLEIGFGLPGQCLQGLSGAGRQALVAAELNGIRGEPLGCVPRLC